MKCKDCLFLFDDYIDEKLKEDEISGIQEHLATCASCSVAYKEFRQEQELFERYLLSAEATPVLWKNLQGAIQPPKVQSWWQRMFEGSVSIPKPALAAALLLMAVAFTSANIMWSKRVVNPELSLSPTVSAPNNVHSQPIEIIERTKTVEVPVVKERVVTHVVYVERQNRSPLKRQDRSSLSAKNERVKNEFREDTITLNGIAADKGYFTPVDLTGFQPTNETKVRVIREVKANEK